MSTETLPQDAAMLLSFINLKLRDYYDNLEELCGSMDVNREELCRKLAGIDYEYDPAVNQFI
ncbi:MAG: DUF4250 domain-containing protein [Lachnospiraceae bacterium]|jgi:hypothetical protein|nr:DUF4250 domain-containing protein [Lachnospiraceae bacterium]